MIAGCDRVYNSEGEESAEWQLVAFVESEGRMICNVKPENLRRR